MDQALHPSQAGRGHAPGEAERIVDTGDLPRTPDEGARAAGRSNAVGAMPEDASAAGRGLLTAGRRCLLVRRLLGGVGQPPSQLSIA